MTTKLWKDKNRMTITQYEVREIDEYGDALHVNLFDSESKALDEARKLLANGVIAVAIEKHVSKYPAFRFSDPETFTTIAVMGDKAALELWGWTQGESTWLEK